MLSQIKSLRFFHELKAQAVGNKRESSYVEPHERKYDDLDKGKIYYYCFISADTGIIRAILCFHQPITAGKCVTVLSILSTEPLLRLDHLLLRWLNTNSNRLVWDFEVSKYPLQEVCYMNYVEMLNCGRARKPYEIIMSDG